MKKKNRRRIGLLLFLLLVIIVIIFYVIGPDKIWDSMLGRTAAITLIAMWILSFVWQIIEAVVYFVKNK